MFLKVLQVIGRSDEYGIHNLGGEGGGGVSKFCGPNGGRGVVQDCCFCQSDTKHACQQLSMFP